MLSFKLKKISKQSSFKTEEFFCTVNGGELKTIMTKNNLTDIWREKNPSVKKYTFRRGNSKSRIDLILITEELSCHTINIKTR
jgi:exonuclease III